MAKEPLVSIITPVYNREAYIGQTIRSVLSQTYRNWEWIIIDDGSTDGTKRIIDDAGEKRIHYYWQQHTGIDGICAMHNKALSLSEGEFIALIDSDDLWPQYKLEHQAQKLARTDSALSYGECCLINERGDRIGYAKIPGDTAISENLPAGYSLREFLLRANSFIFNPTVLVRKKALENAGGFICFNGLAHDFPTWTTLATREKFEPLHECLGYYRKHSKSIVFHHAKHRFLNKLEFIKHLLHLHGGQINLPGFNYSEKEILAAFEKRKREYLNNFSYDRAMLLAGMGMFREAEKEFAVYLEKNYTLKNRLIHKLFSVSDLLNFDVVNAARNIKEKLSG